MISIILTIFNQESLIKQVLEGIYNNSSEWVKELILVFDGCTDNSYNVTMSYMLNHWDKFDIAMGVTNNLFETKANNVGLRLAVQPFCMIIQDDMVVQEENFDQRMMQPMLKWPEVFAVTARTAENDIIRDGHLVHIDKAGIEQNTPRNIFAIRDSCNRGPLLLRTDVLKQLNYLDEIYSPQGLDDHDLCHRAYKMGGWLAGAYWIKYRSDLEWGSSRKASAPIIGAAWTKNAQILMERHHEALIGPKHSEDRTL